MKDGKPVFCVVGGPNGVGKSTLLRGLLRLKIAFLPFVNPDEIAFELGDSSPSIDLQAGREALKRTRTFINDGMNFTRETTLTSREILRSMNTAADAGFEVIFVFVGVGDLKVTKDRVLQRAAKGGHDIPVKVQERRFQKSFGNAVLAAEIADRSYFFENGEQGHIFLAEIVANDFRFATDKPPHWLRTLKAEFSRPE